MKKTIKGLLAILTIVILSACSNEKGPEVWGLYFGETREDVSQTIRSRGYDFLPNSDNTKISVVAEFDYREIKWGKAEISFDEKGRLNGVELTAVYYLTEQEKDKLVKYIKADGFECTEEEISHDELVKKLQRGEPATISFSNSVRYKKKNVIARIDKDPMIDFGQDKYYRLVYLTEDMQNKIDTEKENEYEELIKKIRNGEPAIIHIDLDGNDDAEEEVEVAEDAEDYEW